MKVKGGVKVKRQRAKVKNQTFSIIDE